MVEGVIPSGWPRHESVHQHDRNLVGSQRCWSIETDYGHVLAASQRATLAKSHVCFLLEDEKLSTEIDR